MYLIFTILCCALIVDLDIYGAASVTLNDYLDGFDSAILNIFVAEEPLNVSLDNFIELFLKDNAPYGIEK